jgi:hypothetical protein
LTVICRERTIDAEEAVAIVRKEQSDALERA